MTERVACAAADLEVGTALRVDLVRADGSETPIAIVRTGDGQYCAISDTCSHGQVSLSEGEVDGTEVECWGHGARFDVFTGRPTSLPAIVAVDSYPTRIEGGNVLVDIDAPSIPTKEDA